MFLLKNVSGVENVEHRSKMKVLIGTTNPSKVKGLLNYWKIVI